MSKHAQKKSSCDKLKLAAKRVLCCMMTVLQMTACFICKISPIAVPVIGSIAIVKGCCAYEERRSRITAAIEQQLVSEGYAPLEVHRDSHGADYITGELLARKRMDDVHGAGNYVFESTNFNCKVWYKVKMR